MKLKIEEIIEIPQGIEVVIEKSIVKIKKDNLEMDLEMHGKFKTKIDYCREGGILCYVLIV